MSTVLHAMIRSTSTGEIDEVVVERDTYEAAKAVARAETPEGWQVTSYRVER